MKYTRQIFVICALVFLFGFLAILGWVFRVPVLTSTIPDYPTLKFNTAICFLLASSILYLMAIKRSFPIILSGSFLLLLIAGLTISQDIWDVNFGIDELIIKDNFSSLPGDGSPGRMANATAMCFILLALAFPLLVIRPFKIAGQYLLHLVTFISFTSILAYIFLVPIEMRPWLFATMSINTSILHLLISVGAALINPELGQMEHFTGQKVGSRIASAVFLALTVTSMLIGLFLVHLLTADKISLQFGIAIFVSAFVTIGMFLISTMAAELNMGRNILSQALRKRKREEKFFKSIIESTPAALIAIDEEGTILLVNKMAEQAFGYTQAELIHQSIARLIPKDMRTSTPPYLNIVTPASGTSEKPVYSLLSKQGERIQVEMGISRDVTGHNTMVFLKSD